jgi:hypothetical protein
VIEKENKRSRKGIVSEPLVVYNQNHERQQPRTKRMGIQLQRRESST